METNEIFKYLTTAWHELSLHKFKVALFATLFSFIILFLGMLNSTMFHSAITLYTDTQNIIKPLLGKQTEVTGIKQNRATQVRDIIYSPRQLNKVLDKIYGKNHFTDPLQKENKLTQLRQNLNITGLSGNYIKIAFSNDDADTTFRILNTVVSLFIEDSANHKRQESRNAFDFISQQVETYKRKLLLAEKNLKHFKSTHLEGTETEVDARISTLRTQIESLKIQKMESKSRISSLKKQLFSQKKFSSRDYEASIYHSRLKDLQENLSSLLLAYKDDYPEVIELRYQITDLQNSLKNVYSAKKARESLVHDFNPLYSEISSKLSNSQIEFITLNNRLNAFKVLLENAYERQKQIANNQAELSELNRDNNVTKKLYEDMLANKEKARLSMVLDIQGQGVNYKIQEPANYPTRPSGIRFLHFFLSGPIIAFILIFVLFNIKIILDTKIRFTSQLDNMRNCVVIASFQHIQSPAQKRHIQVENKLLCLYLIIALSIYIAVALAHKYHLSPTQIINWIGQLI